MRWHVARFPAIAVFLSLAACGDTTGPESGTDRLSEPPERIVGTDPRVASRSTVCPVRCMIELGVNALPVQLNEHAAVLFSAHAGEGAFTWSRAGGTRPVQPVGEFHKVSAFNSWHGAVAGHAKVGAELRPVFWDENGQPQLIANLGGSAGYAHGLNDWGTVVGESTLPGGGTRPFVWDRWERVTIDLGGFGGDGRALDINYHGAVVGESRSGTFPFRTQAFLWTKAGGLRGLGTLPEADESTARAISDEGFVVGTSGYWGNESSSRAFGWTAARGMFSLGTLGGWSRATDVNHWGEVVGISLDASGKVRAFVWREDTGMQELPTPDSQSSSAYAINSWGDVLGHVDGRPVVWVWEENMHRWK